MVTVGGVWQMVGRWLECGWKVVAGGWNVVGIWEDGSRTVNNDEPNLKIYDRNF